jgi:WD40 repeat protein
MAFSPDGKLLAAGESNVVKIWVWNPDKATWEKQKADPESELMTYGHLVLSIAFSPDGRTLATGADDATSALWDVGTGRAVKLPVNFMKTSGYVFSVAFSRDGGSLATVSVDASVRLWDIRWRRDQVPIVKYGWAGFGSLAMSPDGRTLATGRKNGTVDLWDAVTRQLVGSISAHTTDASAVAFSSDSQRLASGSEDRSVKVWDRNDFTNPLFTLPTERKVELVVFSPNGTILSTGEKYGSLKLWGMSAPHTLLKDFKGSCDYPKSAAFLPNTNLILASCNGGLKLLDWRNQTELPAPKLSGYSSLVAVSPDGKTFATSEGNDIVLWNTSNLVLRLKGHTGSVSSLAFSPDGTRLASGGYDSTVKIWEIHTGQELATFKAEEGGDLSIVTSLAFTPDGGKLVIGSMSGDIRIWYASSPEEIADQTSSK